MSAQAFANTIINKIRAAIGTDGSQWDSSTASKSMQALADGITEYLIANTQVTISYTGMIPSTPSPIPDPVTTDVFQIVGQCAPTGICNDFDEWIHKIEQNIIAGFQLAPMGMAGIVFPTMPFLMPGVPTTREILKSIHEGNWDNPQLQVWTAICQDIMNWAMGAGMNVTPGGATHPAVAGTGVGTIVSIVVN